MQFSQRLRQLRQDMEATDAQLSALIERYQVIAKHDLERPKEAIEEQ